MQFQDFNTQDSEPHPLNGAQTITDLYGSLGFVEEDELGELTGPPTSVDASPPKPISPSDADRHYGGFARTRCFSGEVRLPRVTGGVLAISCHMDMVKHISSLLAVLYAEDHDHLIQTISGYEQRIRENMPARFGDSRIAPSSWGIAIAINRPYNPEGRMMARSPFGQPVERTRGVAPVYQGTELLKPAVGPMPGYCLYDGHPIVDIAESLGWAWMGRERYPNGEENAYPDPATFAWIRGW